MSGPYRDAGGFVPQETPPAPEPAREPILTRIERACREHMVSLRQPGAVLLGARAFAEAMAEARRYSRGHDTWPPPAGLVRFMSSVGEVVLVTHGNAPHDAVWAGPTAIQLLERAGRVQ
jgi:hypothetical protein